MSGSESSELRGRSLVDAFTVTGNVLGRIARRRSAQREELADGIDRDRPEAWAASSGPAASLALAVALLEDVERDPSLAASLPPGVAEVLLEVASRFVAALERSPLGQRPAS